MSLVEGDERGAIPSMSWSSVVADRVTDVGVEPDADETAAEQGEGADESGAPSASVSFRMTPLADETEAAPQAPEPVSTPKPPPPPISFMMGASKEATPPVSAPDAGDPTHNGSAASPDPVAATPPLSLSIPSVSDTSPTEPPSGTKLVPVELPEIVEATPPESVTQSVAALHIDPTPEPPAPSPVEIAAVVAAPVVADRETDVQRPDPVAPDPVDPPAPVTAAPVVEAPPVADATPVAQPAPAVETAQTAPVVSVPPAVARTQPSQENYSLPRASVPPMVPHASPLVGAGPTKPGTKKDRSTAIARMGFFLLFVAAVVSAGVIFGRPYLFPAEWEDNALPYAEVIEAARGKEFVEPVSLTAQDTATHRDLVSAQLLGDAQAEMPMWRSLGLAGPDATDDASLRDLTSAQSPVLYSTSDGQVYYDEAFTQAHRDRLITQAMAAAALDQELTFSSNAAARELDAEALTEAHVLQQSSAIAMLASTSAVPVPEPDVAALAFLPPVLDYRLTGPIVLGQVLAPVDELAPNPLEGIGADGPVAARNSDLAVVSAPSSVAGDAAVGEIATMDRGFWYLVFASHLDPTTAYSMSNSLERAGMQSVTAADGRTCVVATFATADAAGNESLASSLSSWTATVAPETAASVSTLPDTTVQLRSCDPAGAFTSNARFGTGRELIGWRATEAVVVDTLSADGADAATIARALAQISATPSVQELIALPAGTPPSQVAAAVRTAAADVVATTVAAGG